MIEPLFIVTNNPLSKKTFEGKYDIIFVDGDVMDVLTLVRDKIHLGYKLLTHPLMSSVKPNETPYRTICLSKEKQNLDMQSLEVIESAIFTTKKFLKDFDIPKWNEKILKDFQVIDCDLISHAID